MLVDSNIIIYAVIAATALVHDLQLLTANTDDFKWISDLRLSNPVG